MTFMLCFRVDGDPVAKGRPRFRKVGKFVSTYTPKKTKDFESIVAEAAKQAMGSSEALESPVRCYLYFHMPIPASYPKKRQEACKSGAERYTKKPDADNLGKSVTDAMNGIAYKDDSQIVALHITKVYSDTPGVEVMLMEDLD